jgi:hypothetical protein
MGPVARIGVVIMSQIFVAVFIIIVSISAIFAPSAVSAVIIVLVKL